MVAIDGEPVKFKIDTGAAVTAIPESRTSSSWKLQATPKKLRGAGGHVLTTLGVRTCGLRVGKNCIKEDIYVVDGLVEPLLGQSAIRELGLLSNVDAVVLSDSKWASRYPRLFRGLGKLANRCRISVNDMVEPTAVSAPRRVAAARLGPLKKELERMTRMGVIDQVESPTEWCSPCVVVPKKSGEIRLCIDYTRLNQAVRREYHPLPVTEEVLSRLGSAKVFSKLDANSGYWQMELEEDCRHLTTFITPFGRYRCNRLPFGISLAPEVFQREMSKILEGKEGVVCQMDDILVFGESKEVHDARLQSVLQTLSSAGLTLNKDKCEFEREEVVFLGHVVNAKGIQADPEKVKAIQRYPSPGSRRELKRFMGVVNYLGKFTPELARCTTAMRELLKSSTAWFWGDLQEKEFLHVKRVMASTPVLAPFDMGKCTRLSTDASSFGLGAALLQEMQGDWKPVAYASRSMTQAERRYAQVEKEALAICWAAEKFHFYLAGREFEVETDHKPLVSALGNKELASLPLRLQRFKLRMMAYSYRIFYTPGEKLVLADMLSRNGEALKNMHPSFPEDAIVAEMMSSLPISAEKLEKLKGGTASDIHGQRLLRYCQFGWPRRKKVPQDMRTFYGVRQHLTVIDDIVFYKGRVFIPGVEREATLTDIHRGHQGEIKCIRRAARIVWWPGMCKEIRWAVETCPVCREHRALPPEPLESTPFPQRPWWRIAADLCEWDGRDFLVIIDYFSRYILAEEMPDTRSQTVISKLHKVFCLFGVPHTLVTDYGPQFVSEELKTYLGKWGVSSTTSAPKRPQSNGEAERAVRTVKGLLRRNVDLEAALQSYRDTPLSNGFSPAQLLFGRSMNSVGICGQQKVDLEKLRSKEDGMMNDQTRRYNRRHRVRVRGHVDIGQPVVIRERGRMIRGHVVARAGREVAVATPEGSLLRRNRQNMTQSAHSPDHVEDTEPGPQDTSPRSQSTPRQTQITPRRADIALSIPRAEEQTSGGLANHGAQSPGTVLAEDQPPQAGNVAAQPRRKSQFYESVRGAEETVSRAGRVRRAPLRLNL